MRTPRLPVATAVSLVLLLSSVVLRIASTFQRAYAQDDFFFAYAAWLRSTSLRPNVDYYLPNFTPLSETFAPLFRLWPESFAPLYIARALMLVVGIALVAVTWRLARLLGASVLWALIAANLLSWQFYFLKRIGDIRSDQVGALALMLAAMALLEPRLKARAVFSGILCGLAVAITYKLAIAAPFLCLGAMLAATRRVRAAIVFSAAAAVPTLSYFGARIAIDGWPVVSSTWREILGAVGSGASQRLPVFVTALFNGPLTCVFVIAGAVGFAVAGGRGRAYVLLASGFLATYLCLNPFIFPYNFVILMPLWAVMVAGTPQLVRNQRVLSVLAYVLPAAAVIGGSFGVAQVFSQTNDDQERIVKWVWATTSPRDAVFDWQGFVFGRPSTYHWWTYLGLVPKYQNGWYSVQSEIERAQVRLVLPNYRLTALRQDDRLFLHTHFVEVDSCILAPGWTFQGADLRKGATFTAYLRDADYVVQPAGTRGILLDGRPLLQPRQRIAPGAHVISLGPDGEAPDHIALWHLNARQLGSAPPCRGASLITWYN